jgi:mono/diheme cytochrome c family protein
MKPGVIWMAALAGAATVGNAFAAGSHVGARSALASFTTAQAYQGRFAYIQHCGECHGGDLGGQFGPALAGPHSNVQWQTPGAFYSYMTVQMPVGNAGGLTQTDYLNIAAFVLQSNGRHASAKRLTVNAITNDTAPLDQSQ